MCGQNGTDGWEEKEEKEEKHVPKKAGPIWIETCPRRREPTRSSFEGLDGYTNIRES